MWKDLKGNRHIFPDYIINECGDKMIPNKGNLLFLKSCIYTSNNFPVRILIDEGGEIITCTFVVYISDNYFFEFATDALLANFQSVINSDLHQWITNGACQTVAAKVYQNDYDVVQRVVRVSIEVVFTGLIERIVIEFNVGSNAA